MPSLSTASVPSTGKRGGELETLEDRIRQAIKKLLDDLLQGDSHTLTSLGVYRQKRRYLSKNLNKPKSLPRAELILAALIRMNRELVIESPDPPPRGETGAIPSRIVIKVVKEYSETRPALPGDGNTGIRAEQITSGKMSLLTALEFPQDTEPEIIQQSIVKKGPHRVECSVGLRIRKTGS